MDDPSLAGISAGGAEDEKPPHVRLNLTAKRLVLAAVALYAALRLPHLIYTYLVRPWIPLEPTGPPGQSIIDFSLKMQEQAGHLGFLYFDPRAVLLAAVLLYFSVAQKGNAEERRLRRGEVFTGILNLQILVVAVGLSLSRFTGESAIAFAIGIHFVENLVVTATYCLIGFHLCEGRLFLPMVGFVLGAVASRLTGAFIDYNMSLYLLFGIGMVSDLVHFGWQLGTLIRFQGDFVPFSTGLIPPLRRCAKVFLCSSVYLFILVLLPQIDLDFLSPGASASRLSPVAFFMPNGYEEVMMIYVIPLAFLSLQGSGFDKKSRALILAITVGRFLLALLVGMTGKEFLALAGKGAYLREFYESFGLMEVVSIFFACLASTIWVVFVPLCVFRWWTCGRFARPLLVVFLMSLVVFPYLTVAAPGPDELLYHLLLVQFLVAIVVNATLFRPSPCKEGGPDPS